MTQPHATPPGARAGARFSLFLFTTGLAISLAGGAMAQRPIRPLSPAQPQASAPAVQGNINAAQVVQFSPNLSAAQLAQARVIRMPQGVKFQQLATLRNDQLIETPSGRQVTVGRLRAFRAAADQGRTRAQRPHARGFQMLPATRAPGTPIARGTTAQQLLNRPGTDVVRLPNGSSVTVAQLKLMAPYVEQKYKVKLTGPAGGRPSRTGPAMKITSAAQLGALPPNLPDSTVLETPRGKRITLGELRQVAKAQRSRPRGAAPRRTR